MEWDWSLRFFVSAVLLYKNATDPENFLYSSVVEIRTEWNELGEKEDALPLLSSFDILWRRDLLPVPKVSRLMRMD
jgi:hypothetical protein